MVSRFLCRVCHVFLNSRAFSHFHSSSTRGNERKHSSWEKHDTHSTVILKIFWPAQVLIVLTYLQYHEIWCSPLCHYALSTERIKKSTINWTIYGNTVSSMVYHFFIFWKSIYSPPLLYFVISQFFLCRAIWLMTPTNYAVQGPSLWTFPARVQPYLNLAFASRLCLAGYTWSYMHCLFY